jgi:hypothetical protein
MNDANMYLQVRPKDGAGNRPICREQAEKLRPVAHLCFSVNVGQVLRQRGVGDVELPAHVIAAFAAADERHDLGLPFRQAVAQRAVLADSLRVRQVSRGVIFPSSRL